MVQLPDCSKLLVKPNSTLTFSEPQPGVVQVHVTRGGFRLQRPPGGVHGLQLKLGNQIAKPVGTEFEVDVSDAGETITVIDGAVAVGPEGGEEVRVEAGQRAQWPSGQIIPYDAASDPNKDAGLVAGLPLSQVLTDDGTPEPYGSQTAEFADGKVPADWVWQDPGGDIQLETPQAGTLRLTVPDGTQ